MGAYEPRVCSDEAAWLAAHRLGQFSYASLAAEALIPIERATKLVRAWVRLRAVEELGKIGGNKLQFRVALSDLPQVRRHRESPTVNMWNTMRALKSAFTPTDIAAISTTDAVSVASADAQGYCQMLVRAGYLRVARKASPSKSREAVYRLIRDTGPRPPRERRVRAVWDDNLSTFTHLPEDRP